MFRANILPGQEFKKFSIYEKKTGLTPTGRPVGAGSEWTDRAFYGVLTNASQKEIDQWKQNGHPITHKVTQVYAEEKAKATDYLMLETECGYKAYYVQGTKNPSHLGVTMIYYVEERADIDEVKPW